MSHPQQAQAPDAPPRRPSRTGFAVGYAAATLLLLAGILGLALPVHGTVGNTTFACGTVFTATAQQARRSALQQEQNPSDLSPMRLRLGLTTTSTLELAPVACARTVGHRATWAWAAGGIGAAVLIASTAATIITIRRGRRIPHWE